MVARWSPRAFSGGAEGAAGAVFDEEVVGGDVEGFGEFDYDVG